MEITLNVHFLFLKKKKKKKKKKKRRRKCNFPLQIGLSVKHKSFPNRDWYHGRLSLSISFLSSLYKAPQFSRRNVRGVYRAFHFIPRAQLYPGNPASLFFYAVLWGVLLLFCPFHFLHTHTHTKIRVGLTFVSVCHLLGWRCVTCVSIDWIKLASGHNVRP